ncbi:hypothetical protein BJ508DRAFT_324898 [Ascobolus immersus RN42]|uniref:Uncharacterized protein n=1 Tax=Ascobolus immersus RN42 TaxID=1160509 RepID=A0A3N4IC53_ASCIM|nr:hypothetical protein BJ508DRAFT_324898 [Ascobolus immersus RN42]
MNLPTLLLTLLAPTFTLAQELASIFFFVLPDCEAPNGATVACMDIPQGQCCSFVSGSGFLSSYLSGGNPVELIHKGYEEQGCPPNRGRNGQINIRTFCLSPGFPMRSTKWWRPKVVNKRGEYEDESNGEECVAPNAVVLASGIKMIPAERVEEVVALVQAGDVERLAKLEDYYASTRDSVFIEEEEEEEEE